MVEGTEEVAQYHIGISGTLTGYGPYVMHRDAYHMRQVIIATGEASEDVIIVRSGSEAEARDRIQQWHAQCQAVKAAEQEGDA